MLIMKRYIADRTACYVSFIKEVEIPDDCENPEATAFEIYREDDGKYVGHELGDIVEGYGGDIDFLTKLPEPMFDERKPDADVTADLLAALKTIVRRIDNGDSIDDPDWHEITAARAAIARAESR
jgi:hypothetical protein